MTSLTVPGAATAAPVLVGCALAVVLAGLLLLRRDGEHAVARGHAQEHPRAAVAGGHPAGGGDLQLAHPLVAVVDHCAAQALEGTGRALEAREQVLAARLLGVGELDELLEALPHLHPVGVAGLRGLGAGVGRKRQLLDPHQHVLHALEGGVLEGQALVGEPGVALVLLGPGNGVLDVEDARRGSRVVRGREDALAGADLGLEPGKLALVAPQILERPGVEELVGDPAHDRIAASRLSNSTLVVSTTRAMAW